LCCRCVHQCCPDPLQSSPFTSLITIHFPPPSNPPPPPPRDKDPKFVYYLSAEFLQGRSLLNAVLNLGIKGDYAAALKELGTTLEEAGDQEHNAALGNGGLGRLVGGRFGGGGLCWGLGRGVGGSVDVVVWGVWRRRAKQLVG
jgi:hypothetical protein